MILVVSADPQRASELVDRARTAGFEAEAPPAEGPFDAVLVDEASEAGFFARWAPEPPTSPVLVVGRADLVDPDAGPGIVVDRLSRDRLDPDSLRRAIRYALERQSLRDRLSAAAASVERQRAEKDEIDRSLGRETQELDLLHKIVSHDLNEPLAKIVAYADHLLSRSAGLPSEAARAGLAELRRSQDAFRRVLERIVALARSQGRREGSCLDPD